MNRIAILVIAAACAGCRREPEPTKPDGAAAPSVAKSANDASTFDKQAWLARHPRDDAGRLIPKSTPPPIPSAEMLPVPKRDPNWDLDPDDSARDYVRIYSIATKRYGESLDCVTLGSSTPTPTGRKVEVRSLASCGAGDGVRDVFLVDLAGDHLTVDDKTARTPLARWPDGSDPEGPPTQPIRQATDMKDWKSPLHDAIAAHQIVAIRLQTYGRGTYPVITLAGWHGLINPHATPEQLKPLAKELCKANTDLPIAFFGGLDRSTSLLIRCPSGDVRWDSL